MRLFIWMLVGCTTPMARFERESGLEFADCGEVVGSWGEDADPFVAMCLLDAQENESPAHGIVEANTIEGARVFDHFYVIPQGLRIIGDNRNDSYRASNFNESVCAAVAVNQDLLPEGVDCEQLP